MADELRTQLNNVKQLLDASKGAIASRLPRHLSADRMLKVALTSVNKTPTLLGCTKESLLQSIMMAAELGLEPGGMLGEGYLVPYGKICQFLPGYRGLISLARRSGQIVSLEAHIVHERDKFTYELGLESKLIHVPNLDDEDLGSMKFAYAVAKLVGGGVQFEVMSKAQIDAIRRRSKAGNSGPWVSDYEEMARKGLALDTPIPTPNGWTTMGDLNVGDIVFDKDGIQTNITAISEVKHLPCFRVTFSNNESIVCDDEHRWLARIGGQNAHREEYEVFTVNDLHNAKQNGLSVTIPMQGALGIEHKALPMDPYLLGYWLGDGTSARPEITCNSLDLPFVVDAITKAGYGVGAISKDPRADAFSVGIIDGMLNTLRELDLIKNKHIPAIFMRGSVPQRIALLQGLMDSDGCIESSRGRAKFSSTNKRISDGVFELACSLGEAPSRRSRIESGFGIKTLVHEVEWLPSFCCVSLPRKAAKYRGRKIATYRGVKSIERVDSVPTKCIAVASESKTYLAGESMAITHNTVVRRLFKYLPVSVELVKALELQAAAESGDFEQAEITIEVEAQSVPPTEPEQKGTATLKNLLTEEK